jgi:hypothetical protein
MAHSFKTVGFRQITWHDPQLSADSKDDAERQYWSNFLEQPPVVFLE